MSDTAFSASVREAGSRTILDLQGEINAQADEALNTAYSEAEAGEAEVITLNFTGVAYINRTGIALIVGLLARARKKHRRLVVYGLSEHYQQIFEITRLADFMDIFQDETGALAG